MSRTVPILACLALSLLAGCSLFRKTPAPVATPPQTVNTAESEFKVLKAEDAATMSELGQRLAAPLNAPASERLFRRRELSRDLAQRLDILRQRYLAFLKRHPDYAPALAAYGGLLISLSEEKAAIENLQRALELEPAHAETWNNLATLFGTLAVETGKAATAARAFEGYDKSIHHAPNVALYHNSLAILISLFPAEAAAHYGKKKESMPLLALTHYQRARELAPENFALAAEAAEAHLGIRPLRKVEALAAWEAARKLARNPVEIEWVHLQLALLELEDGKTEAAQKHLAQVTSPAYDKLKAKIALALKADALKPAKP